MAVTALMGMANQMGTVNRAATRVQTVKGVQACLGRQHAVRLKQLPAHRTGWQTSRLQKQHSRSSSAQPAATLPQLMAASSRGSWQLASCKGACRRLLLLLECRSSSGHAGASAAQRHNSCLQHLYHRVLMQGPAAMHLRSNGAR